MHSFVCSEKHNFIDLPHNKHGRSQMSGEIKVQNEYTGEERVIAWNAGTTFRQFASDVNKAFNEAGKVFFPFPMRLISPTDEKFSTSNPQDQDVAYFFPDKDPAFRGLPLFLNAPKVEAFTKVEYASSESPVPIEAIVHTSNLVLVKNKHGKEVLIPWDSATTTNREFINRVKAAFGSDGRLLGLVGKKAVLKIDDSLLRNNDPASGYLFVSMDDMVVSKSAMSAGGGKKLKKPKRGKSSKSKRSQKSRKSQKSKRARTSKSPRRR